MPQALEPLLGPKAAGLAAASIVRLIESWQSDYQARLKRDLSDERVVYLWADGTKELLAVADGERESEQSWLGVLSDLNARGLKVASKLAVADGARFPAGP